MSEHTPGPWEAGRPDMSTIVDGVPSKWIYAGDTYVAAASGMASDDWGVVMANARLIAAAPNLLDALEEIVNNAVLNYEGSMDIYSEAVEAARAAIRKAKGGGDE